MQVFILGGLNISGSIMNKDNITRGVNSNYTTPITPKLMARENSNHNGNLSAVGTRAPDAHTSIDAILLVNGPDSMCLDPKKVQKPKNGTNNNGEPQTMHAHPSVPKYDITRGHTRTLNTILKTYKLAYTSTPNTLYGQIWDTLPRAIFCDQRYPIERQVYNSNGALSTEQFSNAMVRIHSFAQHPLTVLWLIIFALSQQNASDISACYSLPINPDFLPQPAVSPCEERVENQRKSGPRNIAWG
jgi:hypothetical protein